MLASAGVPKSIRGSLGIFDDVGCCTGAEVGLFPPENINHPKIHNIVKYTAIYCLLQIHRQYGQHVRKCSIDSSSV